MKIIKYDYNSMSDDEKREAIRDFLRSISQYLTEAYPNNYQNEIIKIINEIIDDSEAISIIDELIKMMLIMKI